MIGVILTAATLAGFVVIGLVIIHFTPESEPKKPPPKTPEP